MPRALDQKGNHPAVFGYHPRHRPGTRRPAGVTPRGASLLLPGEHRRGLRARGPLTPDLTAAARAGPGLPPPPAVPPRQHLPALRAAGPRPPEAPGAGDGDPD